MVLMVGTFSGEFMEVDEVTKETFPPHVPDAPALSPEHREVLQR